MIVARLVDGVRSHFTLRLQEWTNCFILLECAAVLLRPGFRFESSESYAVMAAVASEREWGVSILAVAGLRLAALVLNGTFARFRQASPYVRAAAACLSVFVWGSLGSGILLANANVFGGGMCLGIGLADIALCVIVAGEAADIERARRDGRATKPKSA